jgi:stringent starvation protein B
VGAIFARENGQGLHFEPVDTSAPPDQTPPTPSGDSPVPPKGKPALKVVK